MKCKKKNILVTLWTIKASNDSTEHNTHKSSSIPVKHKQRDEEDTSK